VVVVGILAAAALTTFLLVGTGGPSGHAKTASARTATTPAVTSVGASDARTGGSGVAPSTGPGPTKDSGPIDSSLENDVINSTWQTFSLAFEQDDLTTLASVSTPSIQKVISGYFLCGCGPWTNVTREVSFSAPPQSGFPRYLLAEVESQNYNQTPLNKEVVFSQAAPEQPWLVAYLGAYGVAGPLFTNDGGSSWTGPPGSVPHTLSSVPHAFELWAQQLDTTGLEPPLPPHMSSDGITSTVVSDAARAHAADQINGLSDTFSHTLQAVSPVFGTPSGNLICAAASLTETVTSKSGDHIVQPQDRSVWTAALAPGTYRTLTEQDEVDSCYLEWPSGTIWEQTNMGGFYQAAGTE
jgi:hypothetical protein